MERLAQRTGSFRIRRINVLGWDSPVSQAHNIQRLPTLMLYDGANLVSRDTEEIMVRLRP